VLWVLLAVALLAAPGSALADEPPPGSVSAAAAGRAADRDRKVIEQERARGELPYSSEFVDGRWEVSYFDGDERVALAFVDPTTGVVTESWTGHQVDWSMARGYEGAFGHKLNAPYVFLPLCAIFLLGLVDWRRLRRPANLDLLALLGFGVSHYFFNRAEIGVSVPLQYLPLLYLLGRALWIGFRGGGEGIRPVWPAAWLLVAALFLLGFRAGLNVADSEVIDVGYASVVGADNVADGEAVYGDFPEDVGQGDTYGPFNYHAYVPFEQAWPWSGSWDDLPAAHAAAIAFDLLAFALLYLLGTRLRRGPPGRLLGATLAFAWAAYPYTAFVLASNSNDTLVAVLLVATLLFAARPMARGALLAAATLTKFAPVLLLPMLATYRDEQRLGKEEKSESSSAGDPDEGTRGLIAWPLILKFALAFGLIAVLLMIPTVLDPGLTTFWDRTVAYQADRDSPFSIWGQVPSLEPLRIAIAVATAALAVLVAFRPRVKSVVQVAALGAALLIAVQLTAEHWFYLYVVWFYPLLLIAFAAQVTGAPRAN